MKRESPKFIKKSKKKLAHTHFRKLPHGTVGEICVRTKEDRAMEIIVRKLEGKERDYCAYIRGLNRKATYMLYFTDDIYGAMSLHTFSEMLRSHFGDGTIRLNLSEAPFTIKSKMILRLISKEEEHDDSSGT